VKLRCGRLTFPAKKLQNSYKLILARISLKFHEVKNKSIPFHPDSNFSFLRYFGFWTLFRNPTFISSVDLITLDFLLNLNRLGEGPVASFEMSRSIEFKATAFITAHPVWNLTGQNLFSLIYYNPGEQALFL
jgi:hypothetical protein